MKIEPRGKYGGVKIHLDPEECEVLLAAFEENSNDAKLINVPKFGVLALKMDKKIRELQAENPELLTDRTPEQVAAILAKEVEKAQMQLNAVKSGKQWQKVDKEELKHALLKHAE